MSWEDRIALLSPAQERKFWIDELTRRAEAGYGMAVNCRHAPNLARSPVLRKLIADGVFIRTREGRGGNCNRTVLILAPKED